MSAVPTRILIIALAIVVGGSLLTSRRPQALDQDDWTRYRASFVAAAGRVVDDGNRGVSHSEGQGYGMLLAVAFDDEATFERLWQWTRRHLQIRTDSLFAWRYDPAAAPPVGDLNSAADGDLLIAWALARAAARWEVERYREAAAEIARDVLRVLVRTHALGAILLPGPEGFVHDGVPTVNLSYWLWPAFNALHRVAPSPLWRELGRSGIALLRSARFGRHELPPDWLRLDAWPAPSPLYEPLYGYNAIRIPLHLVWAGRADRELLRPFLDLAAAYDGAPPATIDLVSGRVSPEPLSAGGLAVLALAQAALADRPAMLPALDERMDYFSASLLLLAKVANLERFDG